MRDQIEVKDYPSGFWGVNKSCAKGHDIYQWILKYAEQDKKKGARIC